MFDIFFDVDVLVVGGALATGDIDGVHRLMEQFNRRVARVVYVTVDPDVDMAPFLHRLHLVSLGTFSCHLLHGEGNNRGQGIQPATFCMGRGRVKTG